MAGVFKGTICATDVLARMCQVSPQPGCHNMETQAFSLEQRLQELQSARVHSVFAQFTDILGSARGKLVPLEHVHQLVDEGAGFSGPSIWGTGLPRTGPRSEYYGRIAPESLQALPWWRAWHVRCAVVTRAVRFCRLAPVRCWPWCCSS